MVFQSPTKFGIFKNRRQKLIARIKEQCGVSSGVVMIAAGFEMGRHSFRQESSFYYLTGIIEPAAILCMYLDGREVLYVPRFSTARGQWVNVFVEGPDDAAKIDVTEVRYLGKDSPGYSFKVVFTAEKYETLLIDLDKFMVPGAKLFTLHDAHNEENFMQVSLYKHLQQWLPVLGANVDASPILYDLRRSKDEYELDLIYKAVQVTSVAQKAAADTIEPGRYEYEVKAAIESVFTGLAGAKPAFPSIVATGMNTTVLHYTQHNKELKANDLIVIDIGAEYGYYTSDITRTYPVSGMFTPRQREIYQLVLDTQLYIESIAAPGMFLRSEKYPEQSLRRLAVNYLDERGGYGKYFCHQIGHYMGLDVHDVGDYTTPLRPGDVFTIEPGIYIPEEGIGVRIEDDYVMADDGAACLSYELAKEVDQIEALMQEKK